MNRTSLKFKETRLRSRVFLYLNLYSQKLTNAASYSQRLYRVTYPIGDLGILVPIPKNCLARVWANFFNRDACGERLDCTSTYMPIVRKNSRIERKLENDFYTQSFQHDNSILPLRLFSAKYGSRYLIYHKCYCSFLYCNHRIFGLSATNDPIWTDRTHGWVHGRSSLGF